MSDRVVVCPAHGRPTARSETRYGGRFDCVTPGCTVVCWDNPTSTPADDETRAFRRACHAAFDPLWRDRTRSSSRNAAYRWLQRWSGLSSDEAHIGMFDLDRCQALLAELRCEEPS